LPKKTLNAFKESNNDYVVKVKKNQPKLLKSIQQTIETSNPIDCHTSIEKSRGRVEKREVSVFYPLPNIPDGWTEVNRIVYVRRSFKNKKNKKDVHHQSKSFYISSLKSDDAKLFSKGIRGHWHIENRLHYVKDVIMNEDKSRIRNVSGASNFSMFRNMAINIVRQIGFDSVKNATIFFASNIQKLFNIIRI